MKNVNEILLFILIFIGHIQDGILNLETKYYKTNIQVYEYDRNTPISQMNDYHDAWIHFGLDGLRNWTCYLDKHDPPLRMVLCLEGESISEEMETFCLDNYIEIVDIKEDENYSLRVLQVLECHVWPDLNLVNSLDSLDIHDANDFNEEEDHEEKENETIQKIHQEIFNEWENEDGFDLAFGKLSQLKGILLSSNRRVILKFKIEKAQTLPFQDRQRLAAQVALSFAMQFDKEFHE